MYISHTDRLLVIVVSDWAEGSSRPWCWLPPARYWNDVSKLTQRTVDVSGDGKATMTRRLDQSTTKEQRYDYLPCPKRVIDRSSSRESRSSRVPKELCHQQISPYICRLKARSLKPLRHNRLRASTKVGYDYIEWFCMHCLFHDNVYYYSSFPHISLLAANIRGTLPSSAATFNPSVS